jgi:hypothetical protein
LRSNALVLPRFLVTLTREPVRTGANPIL